SYPRAEVGGDFFDYLDLPDGSLAVAIGDVAGSGIGPALLAATTRAYLRAQALAQADLGALLGQVDSWLRADMEGGWFGTLLLARLDPRQGTLVYANAAHATGYVLDGAGRVRAELRSTGLPLGILPDGDYPTTEALALSPGDLVLLLTDGVEE